MLGMSAVLARTAVRAHDAVDRHDDGERRQPAGSSHCACRARAARDHGDLAVAHRLTPFDGRDRLQCRAVEPVDQTPVEPYVLIEAHSVASEVVIEQMRELVGGAGIRHRHLTQASGDVFEKPRNGGVDGFGKVEAHDPLVGEDHERVAERSGGEVVAERHDPILTCAADVRAREAVSGGEAAEPARMCRKSGPIR